MLEVAGYYDGVSVRLLDKVALHKNQRVIVKIMETADDDSNAKVKRPSNKVIGGKSETMAAFEALEMWRARNRNTLQSDIEVERELLEAIDEKYGIAD